MHSNRNVTLLAALDLSLLPPQLSYLLFCVLKDESISPDYLLRLFTNLRQQMTFPWFLLRVGSVQFVSGQKFTSQVRIFSRDVKERWVTQPTVLLHPELLRIIIDYCMSLRLIIFIQSLSFLYILSSLCVYSGSACLLAAHEFLMPLPPSCVVPTERCWKTANFHSASC